MENVKNYLNTMFSNFPNTKDVEKAKNELYQMMEDKYTELLNEGKSESEILSIIISEFGSVDEIAEEFGIVTKDKKKKVKVTKEVKLYNVGLEEAKKYISVSKWSALRKAVALAIIVLSAIPLYIGESFNDVIGIRTTANYISLIVQVFMVLVGIGILIFDMIKMTKWEKFEDGICRLNDGVYLWVAGHKENTSFLRKTSTILSFMSYTIGILVGILISSYNSDIASIEDTLMQYSFGMGCSLGFVAIGVFLMIFNYAITKSYKNLMIWENVDEESDNYKIHYIYKKLEFIMPLYWQTVVALYLIISFLTYYWYITWIIIPFAYVTNQLIDRFFGKE